MGWKGSALDVRVDDPQRTGFVSLPTALPTSKSGVTDVSKLHNSTCVSLLWAAISAFLRDGYAHTDEVPCLCARSIYMQDTRPVTHHFARMHFILPDLPSICPFPPSLNPHYGTVASESKDWITSFGILSDRQQGRFSKSDLELLASHTYPYADREGCRTACDFINIVFILDDFSDDEEGRGARRMADSFMGALKDPAWDDGTPFAKLARE